MLSEVASAADLVDLNLVAGAAVPRWNRFKNIVIAALCVTSVLLAIGYINLSRQVTKTQTHGTKLATQVMAIQDRQTKILLWGQAEMVAARAGRKQILALLKKGQ